MPRAPKKLNSLKGWVVHPPGHTRQNTLLQRMPGSKYRLNPEYVDEIAVWLLAFSSRWARLCTGSTRGMDAHQRKAAIGRMRAFRYMLSAVECMLQEIRDTQSVDRIENAYKRWFEGDIITSVAEPENPDQLRLFDPNEGE